MNPVTKIIILWTQLKKDQQKWLPNPYHHLLIKS